LPSGGWQLRPGSIDVFIDAPIATEEHRAGKLKALSDQVRAVIAARLQQQSPGGPLLTASALRLKTRSA
jgi:hypothetical protein